MVRLVQQHFQSNTSLNSHMQPCRQVARYRNEIEVFSILKKELALLIVFCVLMLVISLIIVVLLFHLK